MPGKRTFHRLRGVLALAVLGVTLASGLAGDAKNGDALPDGALRRLGSLQWRHGEPITFLAMPADGKTLATATHDSVLRLWDRETGKEIRRFVSPDNLTAKGGAIVHTYMQGLTRAAMSKDGKLLAVALPGNMVQLWEIETGKALRQVKSPINGVSALAFTPDGKTIAVRGINDRTCILYEVETGKEIRKLKATPPGGKAGNIFGGAGDGTGLAISADGKTIALAELEFDGMRVSGSVTLFDLATGKEGRRIASPQNGIAALAFSPDGKTIVFNTYNALHFHSADTGAEIRKTNGNSGGFPLCYSPDGQTLAVKGRDHLVRLYDPNTGNLLRTVGELPGQKGGVITNSNGAVLTDVAYSADSKTLVIGGQQMPRFFEVATGKEQILLGGGHRGAVSAVSVSADGKTIASRGAEGTLRVWNSLTGEEIRQLPEPAGTSAVLFSPDGKLAAFGSNDGTLRLIDVADGKQKHQIKAHQGTIAAIAFSADGKRIATRGCYDGLLRVYDVEKGTHLKQITYQDIQAGNNGVVIFRTTNGQRDPHPLAFSPDGKTLVTFIASQQIIVQGRQQVQPDSNCLRFYDVGTGKEIRQIPMPTGRSISQLAFSLDGRILISENVDKTISLWEVASGQERSRLGAPIASPNVTTSTSFIAVNGRVRTGPAVAPFGVTLATSRDGSLIAAPGAKNTIHVFDTWLGKVVGTFPGHDGATASLTFAPDAKTLVSGGHDTTLLVWDLARLNRDAPPQVAAFPAKEFDRLWTELISNDAAKAGQTVQTLIAGANVSVALLKDRIQPAAPVDIQKVDRWLRDLDSSNFKKRSAATNELEKLGELAIPALQKVLASEPTLETRRRVEPMLEELTGRNLTKEQIRTVRVIEVLDRVGSAEAKEVLERLATGAPGSLTTRQAQASLDRLVGNKK